MKRFLVVFGVLSALMACSNGGSVMGSPDAQNAEVEIRAAICEIENGNFKSAQSTLESVLKKDPKNIYALRLLPGVAARQVKEGDKSPENAALIRKAIDAYESAAANPLLKNERAEINNFIISLYGMLGSEEKSTALLKKAENESEDPKQRAAFYTSLAADNYACANDISDVAPVKSIVKRNGKEVYVFRKPQNPADFDKLKSCASKGSELIGKAVALDPASDTIRSYQASLFAQLARVAEMEGKADEKARLMKESEAARDKFFALSRQRSDEQAKKDAEPLAKTLNDSLKFSPADFTEAQYKELREELKSYRFEKPLAETVDSVDIPFSGLVAPIAVEDDMPDDAATKPARLDDEQQKSELKIFSPEGGFSAELPANAAFSSTSDSRIYTASGNGLSFFILETSRSRDLSENEQDMALNILAWILTKYVASRYVGDGRWNDRFESELTRKDKLKEHPARFYAYRLISCREKKEGTMLFVIGAKKNYAIDIRGAGESDERVQRFLKSLKLA
jgi:hypothetical protein